MYGTRRQFLTYLGLGTYTLLNEINHAATRAAFPLRHRKNIPEKFRPIRPSTADSLILPSGFRSKTLCKSGDPLGHEGPLGKELFGYDNDFIAYFPIDCLKGGKKPNDGLLWVNHEFIKEIFVSGYSGGKKSKEQVRAEKLAVGGSVLRVTKEVKKWKHLTGSEYTRRFTASYPKISFTGPAKEKLHEATGTLANCSGGVTLWNTVLSCEENFHKFNPLFGWADVSDEKINELEYGWVVEIDPFNELPPRKHSSLGRFAHENAAVHTGRKGRLVVYMGDDSADQHLYKYISQERFQKSHSRAEQRALLENGTLYVANFEKGHWIPLDISMSSELKNAGFSSQADVLIDTRRAAKIVGGTPLDRPEDCEIHPKDGSLYLALTNGKDHGNLFGQILRIIEDNDDAESLKFRFEIFLAGGPQSGLACPDNLLFDKDGNLWVACDISTSDLNTHAYEIHGNNGLYMVPTQGKNLGNAYQFASGPIDAELTGPCFNSNQDTLFLSVQHPGESTKVKEKPTSHWPEGSNTMPKPAVVAITGF